MFIPDFENLHPVFNLGYFICRKYTEWNLLAQNKIQLHSNIGERKTSWTFRAINLGFAYSDIKVVITLN